MCKYVIVDLEMCRVAKGIEEYALGTEIIQLGAVMTDENFATTSTFSTFVKPQFGVIDSYIQELTGISQEDTEAAPAVHEVLKQFVEWLPDDAVLVSWSVSDENQVRNEIEAKGIKIPGIEKYLDNWIDCQKTFSFKMNTDKNYNLTEALNITGIDYDDGAHDALVDAHNTALLFAKMKREPKLQLSSYYSEDTSSEKSVYSPFSDLMDNLGFSNS